MPHHRDESRDLGRPIGETVPYGQGDDGAWKIGRTEPDLRELSLSSPEKSLGRQIVDRLIELTSSDRITWEFFKRFDGAACYRTQLPNQDQTVFWVGAHGIGFAPLVEIGDASEIRIYNPLVRTLFELVLAKDGVRGPDSALSHRMSDEQKDIFLAKVLLELKE